MPLPEPEPGLVISYAYLWHHEHDSGVEEALMTPSGTPLGSFVTAAVTPAAKSAKQHLISRLLL
jgi:hypothetical protein